MDHQPQRDRAPCYQIKVAGHLDPAWADWFEALTLTHDPDGCTAFTGTLVDQAALHGVLIKIRDLGLSLISVQRLQTYKSNHETPPPIVHPPINPESTL